MIEYAPAKSGEYPSDIPQFLKLFVLQKLFEGYKEDIHLWTFFLFLKAHSFPWANKCMLSENYSLPGTGNVCGQISEHIFASNGGYCFYVLTMYSVLYNQEWIETALNFSLN